MKTTLTLSTLLLSSAATTSFAQGLLVFRGRVALGDSYGASYAGYFDELTISRDVAGSSMTIRLVQANTIIPKGLPDYGGLFASDGTELSLGSINQSFGQLSYEPDASAHPPGGITDNNWTVFETQTTYSESILSQVAGGTYQTGQKRGQGPFSSQFSGTVSGSVVTVPEPAAASLLLVVLPCAFVLLRSKERGLR
jgi:hypothetical protein